MRIIHTADWHLGHTLHDFSREAEHAAFLDWLLRTLAEQDADALLIAGDVFDSATPPPSAQRSWYAFLARAWGLLPHLQIVVIAGNHDSAQRLEATRPLLEALGRLHVIGSCDRERVVVPLLARDGSIAAWLGAVPFLRPADLPVGMEAAQGIAQVHGEILAAARARCSAHQALLAMGHCYMVGGAISELSERRIQCGNQAALPVDLFPNDVTYAALGHLHLAQSVGGRPHVRYAGSPLPLSLSEGGYHHSVTLLELVGAELGRIEALPVPRHVEILRLPASGAESWPLLRTELAKLAPCKDGDDQARYPFLELAVRLDRPEPTLRADVTELLQSRAVRLVRLGVSHAGEGGGLADAGLVLGGLDDLQPDDVFATRWRQKYGEEPQAGHADAFAQLWAWAQARDAAGEDRQTRRARAEAGG